MILYQATKSATTAVRNTTDHQEATILEEKKILI
jgi:hypothetical protein